MRKRNGSVVKKYVLLVLALGAAAGACAESAPRADSTPAQPNGAASAGDSGDAASGASRDSSLATPRDSRAATGDAARPSARPSVVFAGTSLTAGLGLDPDSAYPVHVQRLIDSAGLDYEVVNAGVSGETSSALLRRLDWLLREPFAVFVIETGANDGLRGIPVPTMQSNIERIVDRVRATRPGATVALVRMEAPPNMGAEYTREFREVYPAVARARGIPLLPFLLEDVAGIRELNQGDGIHPNYRGSRILARNVWKGLRPLLR